MGEPLRSLRGRLEGVLTTTSVTQRYAAGEVANIVGRACNGLAEGPPDGVVLVRSLVVALRAGEATRSRSHQHDMVAWAAVRSSTTMLRLPLCLLDDGYEAGRQGLTYSRLLASFEGTRAWSCALLCFSGEEEEEGEEQKTA